MAGAGWICSVRLRCQIDTAFLSVVGAFDLRDGVLRHAGSGDELLLAGLYGVADILRRFGAEGFHSVSILLISQAEKRITLAISD